MTVVKRDNQLEIYSEKSEQMGYITWEAKANQVLVITGTFVDPAFRGQGVAGKLVQEVVAFARTKSCQLGATCPFAKKVLMSTTAYHDVLDTKILEKMGEQDA